MWMMGLELPLLPGLVEQPRRQTGKRKQQPTGSSRPLVSSWIYYAKNGEALHGSITRARDQHRGAFLPYYFNLSF
jgi:hypothetical protein